MATGAFDPQGLINAYLLDTAPASFTAPTVASITAGERLTPFIVPDGVTGFTTSPGYTDSTSLDDDTETKVPSLSTVQEGKIVFKAPRAAADDEMDAWDAIDVGVQYYLAIVLAKTPAAGGLAHILAAKCANKSVDDRTGKKLATWTADFAPGQLYLYSVIAA